MHNIIESAQKAIVTINKRGTAVASSLAIAEGVGNPHASVIKLIRQNIEDLQEFGMVGFEIQPKNKGVRGGSDTEYALLNEPQATLLLTYMRNNDVVRAFKKRLVKAFYELRSLNQPQHPDLSAVLSDPQHLRGLLSDYTEKVIELEQKVAEQAPKIKAYEHLIRADGTMCITDAAKALEVRPKDLFAYMLQNSWVYRRQGGGNLIPYQDKIQRGLLDCSTTTVYRSDGTEKITTQTRVTPKGLALLEQNYKELVV